MSSKDSIEVKILMLLCVVGMIIGQTHMEARACCYGVVGLPLETSGGCGCGWFTTQRCGDYYQQWRIFYCVFKSSGSKNCTYTYQTVGYRWGCNESTNWCGVLVCAALNAGVCAILCAEAAKACAAMCAGKGGTPECTYAAMDCWDCLTGEGIDCGCIVRNCEVGSVTHRVMANSAYLSGGLCP